MTEQAVKQINIRSDLVDTAVGFLKSSKVSAESKEKKREFLLKKGLTDNEIDYAFQIVPQKESSREMVRSHRGSFLRRILVDLALACSFTFIFKLLKRWFRSRFLTNKNELNETIKNLQNTIRDMQASLVKLERTADQLNSTTTQGSSSLDDVKREIQSLKGLLLNRSQFPSLPKVGPPSIPSWQLAEIEKQKSRLAATTTDTNINETNNENKEDTESIVVISENDKKSDDENHSSITPSSYSISDA